MRSQGCARWDGGREARTASAGEHRQMSGVPRLPARVRLADSVRPRFGAERGFLFDERSGRVYSLNATGAVAAARLHERASVADVLAAVTDAFEVDPATARRDLATFLAQLVQEGLAEIVDG
jgi:PqqD family protein of HPr-rel-A system